MATPVRRTDRSLESLLFSRPFEFEFFQAVTLLGRLFPQRSAVGEGTHPEREVVRFHARASMSFPPSQIHGLDRSRTQNGPPAMTVAFMGLTGPQGILPAHYTEMIVAEDMAGKSTLADFLDIFNHRLISLFYRAWQKHHFIVGYEREARGEADVDRFTRNLFALIGMGTPRLTGRLPVPDIALLRYAGLIAQRPHSAVALRGMLRDYFGVPIEIEQFAGRWYALEQESLAYLDAPGPHNQLGLGAIAGDAVWNQQALFCVKVGPVTLDRFHHFLPDGEAFKELTGLTRYFCGDTLDFDVQVILAAAEVPSCILDDERAGAPRLGWSGWLKTEPFEHDARDSVFIGATASTRVM